MPIKLTELIARVSPDVEAKVKRVRDQTRSVIQEALRAECRLTMRSSDEREESKSSAQVRVDVSSGHPATLREITFADDFDRIMLLGRYRSCLEQAQTGITGLFGLRKELSSRPNSDRWVRMNENELQSVAEWSTFLLKTLNEHDPLKTVLSVRDDFLGVYEYDASDALADDYTINRAGIRLYWGVIGLVSEWLGCTVEDLTIVVLTHELAHAHTQLGADIEGRRWPAPLFHRSESSLKEGLAQYYTDRVLRRLERRYAGALHTYEKMIPGQSKDYQSHKEWTKNYSPEAVRLAMLEVRRWKLLKLEDFKHALELAQEKLHGSAKT